MLTYFAVLPAAAQNQQPSAATAARPTTGIPTPRSEWLGSFHGITVSGHMQVRLIKNAVEEGPRITFDPKGEFSTKFKAAVDKNGILRIEEPVDPRRTTVTEVTVWCNDISSLSVAAAELTFDTPIARDMFDLEVTGGANVRARFDVDDLSIVETGRSSLVVEGRAKYLTLDISTAKFDGSQLQTTASDIEASHAAEVHIAVSERLRGTTSTAAKILYTGKPSLIRARTTMFGGEIAQSENRVE